MSGFKWPLPVVCFVSLVAVVLPCYGDVFEPAASGCPMAHCDANLSDLIRVELPVGTIGSIWHTEQQRGSLSGLGCSSNANIVACALTGPRDNVVVYDFAGNRLWGSGLALNWGVVMGAPVVATDGGVLAADSSQLVRFDPGGQIAWTAPLIDGGLPFGPVLTNSGVVVVATFGGPVYAFDSANGELLAKHWLVDGETTFGAWNSPAVRGERAYVLANQLSRPENGRLFALDIDAQAGSIEVAWHYAFGGPSGASPLLVGRLLFFDADRGPNTAPNAPLAPHIFSIMDTGDSPVELWRLAVSHTILASMALDPRGALWFLQSNNKYLTGVGLLDGAVLQYLDVDALTGEPGEHRPGSALNIAGSPSQPSLIFSATRKPDSEISPDDPGSSYVLAVDLNSSTLLWRFPLGDHMARTSGQFSILEQATDKRVLFSTRRGGIRALGTQ